MSPRLPAFSAYSLFAEQASVTLMSKGIVRCPTSPFPVLRLQFPPWGEGGRIPKKKKKTKWEVMLVHYWIPMIYFVLQFQCQGEHSFPL